MLNLNTLRSTITKVSGTAASHRKMAEQLLASADTHAANGDETRAKLDRESAERYLQDAESSENQVNAYMAEIQVRERRAKHIEKQIQDLTKDFEYKLAKLRDEERSIL